MNTLTMILIGYVLFAILVAIVYTWLYHIHFMSDKVKRQPRKIKIKIYGRLFISVFVAAPYCLYEIIKTKRTGGFSK